MNPSDFRRQSDSVQCLPQSREVRGSVPSVLPVSVWASSTLEHTCVRGSLPRPFSKALLRWARCRRHINLVVAWWQMMRFFFSRQYSSVVFCVLIPSMFFLPCSSSTHTRRCSAASTTLCWTMAAGNTSSCATSSWWQETPPSTSSTASWGKPSACSWYQAPSRFTVSLRLRGKAAKEFSAGWRRWPVTDGSQVPFLSAVGVIFHEKGWNIMRTVRIFWDKKSKISFVNIDF